MKIVDEYPSLEFLKERGIPVVPAEIARTEAEALTLSSQAGYPVVFKISSEKVAHKTELGGVILNIKTPTEALSAWNTLMERAHKAGLSIPETLRGIAVQPMVKQESEFIIGATRDTAFGPIVMFGLGGIYTELYKDVAFRLAPVTPRQALGMIMETKAGKILEGFRTGRRTDPADLVNTLVKVSEIMAEKGEIKEIDINPFVLTQDRGIALDCLITYF